MAEEKTPERGMVVFAHADDADWGCSGTVALWCKQGMEVVYVVCTDGSKGSDDPDMISEQLTQVRRDEQLAAGEVLGLKEVVFLGYEDAMLQPSLELRRDITRQIRRFKPEILITTSPTRTLDSMEYIGHPDHFAAGEAALSAVFPAARDRLTFPELLQEGLEPHKVRELLVMDRSERATKWIDVTDTIDIAIEALKRHESQVTPEDAERYMRLWREENGKVKGMKYAEAFRYFRLD